MERNRWFLMNGLIIVSLMAVMMSVQSCTDPVQLGNKFINKPPSVDVTKDSIFSEADRAKRFLWHAYRTLPYREGLTERPARLGHDMLASLTDINQTTMAWGHAIDTYYHPAFPWSPNHDKYNYTGPGWGGIRNAYIFIENVDQVPDMNAATKKRLKAEARMIIAVHYTGMFRNFGGLPWVDHAFDVNEKLDQPRMTARATLDSILTVIDRAIPNLPFALKNTKTEAGRFTQAGAMGLKCRVLLFGASPLFNSPQPYMQGEASDKKLVWYGSEDHSLWKKTADACETLIDKVGQTGAYYLVDTGHPQEDFYHGYYKRNSSEILISTRSRYKSTTPWGGSYYGEITGSGAGPTTDNYVKMFPMANGKPINNSTSGYDPAHPYKNRDPRLYETVLVNGASYQGRTAELWIGGRERETKNTKPTAWGYRMHKFVRDATAGNTLYTPIQWPYLRLSEIYLSYAEALNEVNGGPTPEAYKYVNKVRNRVDLGDLPKGLSQKDFWKAVIRERVLEMGYERTRLYDMIRWKMKKTFTKPLYGMDICKKGVSSKGACQDQDLGYHESNNYIYARFRLPIRQWQKEWSPKWYLSPFPQKSVSLGTMQNPGWEL